MNIHVEDYGEMPSCMILVVAPKKSDNGLSEENYTKYINEQINLDTIASNKIVFNVHMLF